MDEKTKRAFGMPAFVIDGSDYLYRVSAVRAEDLEESNFSEEISIKIISGLSDPVGLSVRVDNIRVRPIFARLSWSTQENKSRPDKWTVERKHDIETDTFSYLGSAYLSEEFFDRTIKSGNSYIYRVRSIDTIGRTSDFFEVRLSV